MGIHRHYLFANVPQDHRYSPSTTHAMHPATMKSEQENYEACGNVDMSGWEDLTKKHQCTVQKFVNTARKQHGHYEHCLLCHGFDPSFLLAIGRSLRHMNKLRSANEPTSRPLGNQRNENTTILPTTN